MSDLRQFADFLGGEVRGDSVYFPAPGHSALDRGMSLKLDPTAPDGLLINSFNGGDPLAVKDMLRAKGVLPERERARGDSWRVAGVYEFTDESGAALYRTRRHEHPAKPKRFTVERPDGRGGWIDKLGDTRRVLYRLPELIAADPAQPVYLVEGERKADKLAAMGLTATAIAFGGKSWRAGYAEPLAGRTVAILPDNDAPGLEFAERARGDIVAAGGKAFLVELPGLPPKGDIIDWAGTADELLALTEATINAPGETFPLLDLAALADTRPEPRAFALDRFIPAGELTLFTGPGGAGKSLFAQQLATSIAAGHQFLGVNAMHGRTLYLTAEDDERELHWRQDHIARRLGVPLALMGLHLASLRGRLGNELCTFDVEGRLRPSPAFAVLCDTIRAAAATFVILDNVAHLFAGNENDRGQVTQFTNLLNRLARDTGATILLVAHPNKAGDSYSGSTAWLNAVRSQIRLDWQRDSEGGIADPDARELKLGKANYARAGETLAFRWHDFALILEEELPTDQRADLAANLQANAENDGFMRCLATATASRRAVSHNPGVNYAPTVFARMTEGKGFTRQAYEHAFERLWHLGRIELDQQLWQAENRHWKVGIRAAKKCANPPANLPSIEGKSLKTLAPTPAPTPCANPRQPPSQVIENACATVRAPTPLHPTGVKGQALGAACPLPDSDTRDPFDDSLWEDGQ